MLILSWIKNLFSNLTRTASSDWEMERYLSQAVDGVDLERRMREWDRTRLNQNSWMSATYEGTAR
jgi:hypothetical protein